VLRVSGRDVIGGVNRLRNLIALNAPGDALDIEVLRGGQRQTVRATLIDPEAGTLLAIGAERVDRLGVYVIPNTAELSQRRGYRRHIPGLIVVARTDPQSPAEDATEAATLQANDLIVEVEGREVGDVDDLRRQLDKAGGDGAVRVDIIRGNLRGYLEVGLE